MAFKLFKNVFKKKEELKKEEEKRVLPNIEIELDYNGMQDLYSNNKTESENLYDIMIQLLEKSESLDDNKVEQYAFYAGQMRGINLIRVEKTDNGYKLFYKGLNFVAGKGKTL